VRPLCCLFVNEYSIHAVFPNWPGTVTYLFCTAHARASNLARVALKLDCLLWSEFAEVKWSDLQ
jgi:hypothetical protein